MDTAEDKVIPAKACLKELPISASHLYALIHQGRISAVWFGGRVYLRQSVLDRLKVDGTLPQATPVIGGNGCQ